MKDNKINVDLLVPSISKKYNVFIPVNKTVGETVQILINNINEMNCNFLKLNNYSLLDVYNNTFLEFSKTIIELGIKNGSSLALI